MASGAFNPVYEVPAWVRESPELIGRGIELVMILKPVGTMSHLATCMLLTFSVQGIAWRGPDESLGMPCYAVKIVKESSQEAEIYEQLGRYDRASPNHTLPCDVIRYDCHRPILIMPCAEMFISQISKKWSMSQIVDCFRQIVEVGVFSPFQR